MSNGKPLQESDLIFSAAASTLKTTLTDLKRSNLSITNRLQSITVDADFVSRIATIYGLPLVANERCGSWYIRPERKGGSAYFKSTDGHFGQWAFSLRRLNLPIFDVLHQHHGCIIVDSTRRGKSFPDALSKTVPIWVTVLNRLLFPDDIKSGSLQTPYDVVSPSEHSQIEQRLDGFVEAARGLHLDLDTLRGKLHGKPLRVTWVRPNGVLPLAFEDSSASNYILACVASSRDSHEQAPSSYVQGAADDSESWAHGLTAPAFWENHQTLLSTSEDDLPGRIASLVAAYRFSGSFRAPTLVKPTSNLYIGDLSTLGQVTDEFDIVVACVTQPPAVPSSKRYRLFHLVCSTGKVGSRELRTELCKLDPLGSDLKEDTRVLVVCESGKDIAVGATLAVLCNFFDTDGHCAGKTEASGLSITKALIKLRLSWIVLSIPDASPSRATLQSVNSYLMG